MTRWLRAALLVAATSAWGCVLADTIVQPTRREVIIAGAPSEELVLRVWVPHRGDHARYRVSLLQVAGEEFTLMDPAAYETVISR